jgi:biofilm PGA synthesis protein PgaA
MILGNQNDRRQRKMIRLPRPRCIWLMLVLLTLASAFARPQPGIAPRTVREAAVAQARSGDARTAMQSLRKLLQTYPEDSRLLADTTIVANWAGEDAYAIELYERASTPKDDAGVVEAAARSARNLHRYDLALKLFGHAEFVAPDRWQAKLGEAMVLTDQADYAAAVKVMEPLLRDHIAEVDVESGEAYLCSRRGDYPCVIGMDQRLMAQKPAAAHKYQDQMALALAHIRGDSLAFDLRGAPDKQLAPYLTATQAAEHIRWAEYADHTWTERKSDSEQALAMLDSVIRTSSPQDVLWKQAQADRILALSDLRLQRRVIDAWKHLVQMHVDVPDYALGRVAKAYLTLRHPRDAEPLYRVLVLHVPGDADYWSGLAYSQFEQENIREAFATIDQVYLEAPSEMRSKGLKDPQFNKAHIELGTQAAEMRGFTDMPRAEQVRLSRLLNAAPENSAVDRAMAATFLARGWPLLAMREERIADSYEEMDERPVLEDAEIYAGAGRLDDAEALIPSVLLVEGNSPPMERFLRERSINREWQIEAESGYEWSSGQFLGNSQHSDGHLYSPLIHNRWRAFLHGWGENGDFQEGATYRARSGGGVNYDYARQSAWAEIAADTGTAGTRTGFVLGGQFAIGDHWTFRAEGDTDNVTDVQLIAELAGVHARSLSLNAVWSQSELRSIHAGGQRMLFSDGNQRTDFSASWDERIVTAPHLQIEISPEEWNSANSENENRIYFNPKRDFSLGPRTTAHWLTWRRYETKFSQDMSFYAAPYWQQHYGTAAAVAASYGQLWKLSPRFGAFAKVKWNSQPYDGKREPYTDLTFGLKWGPQ